MIAQLTVGLLTLALQASAVVTGQTSCTSRMCITGMHDSDTNLDTYTLGPPQGSTLPFSSVGYMAIGFGSQMAGSPMVITWPNSDGSITLSHRQAAGRIPPAVVANPPRTASLLSAQSFSNSTSTSISFTLPSNADSTSNATSLIWAVGTTNPGPSPSAAIGQHGPGAFGVTTLAIMTPLQAAAGTSGTGTGTGSTTPSGVVVSDTGAAGGGTADQAKILITHGILGALAAMLFVPLGVLVPRLGRGWNTSRWWYSIHAVIGLMALALAASSFGYARAQFAGGFNTTHRQLGLAFFILIILQFTFGISLRFIKSRPASKATSSSGRGPVNYLHIVMGLGVLSVGFATVYTGLTVEWMMTTGLPNAGTRWIVGWAVVVGVVAAAWLVGLALLPKQLRNEKAARGGDDGSSYGGSARLADREKPVHDQRVHTPEDDPRLHGPRMDLATV